MLVKVEIMCIRNQKRRRRRNKETEAFNISQLTTQIITARGEYANPRL